MHNIHYLAHFEVLSIFGILGSLGVQKIHYPIIYIDRVHNMRIDILNIVYIIKISTIYFSTIQF